MREAVGEAGRDRRDRHDGGLNDSKVSRVLFVVGAGRDVFVGVADPVAQVRAEIGEMSAVEILDVHFAPPQVGARRKRAGLPTASACSIKRLPAAYLVGSGF